MLRSQCTGANVSFASRVLAGGAIGVFAAVLGGCSTDFKRLEQPSYTVGETNSLPPRPSEPIRRSNAGAPVGSETWQESGPRGQLPPVTADQQRPVSTPLPPPATAGGVGPSRPFDAPKAKAAAIPAQPAKPLAVASNRTVEVQPGDTLYAISKRTGYPISALMEANGLKTANLKPGQKLALPAGAVSRKPMSRATAAADTPVPGQPTSPAAPAATAPMASAPAAPVPAAPAPVAVASDAAGWTGTHTIKAGESLYAIARQHKIPVAVLQQQNSIADPTKLRPGVTLKVPGTTGEAPAAAPSAPPLAAAAPTLPPRVAQAPTPPVEPVAAPQAAAPAPGSPQPKIINAGQPKSEQQVASLGGTASDATTMAPIDPPAAQAPTKPNAVATPASGAKFRWPVRGSVLSGFGKRPDGTHNDGVNIAVPFGADVVAADTGTVAYAGNELKGYGNLVLIRHDNGWVSAYAHADQLLVKRGDAIKRGQVIAKAGKTGTVDQPQVHFELRQGSKPVDPMPHMEKQ